MEIEMALRQFRKLAESARNGEARHRMPPQVFEKRPHEITHVDQRYLGQTVEPLYRPLRGTAGGARDVRDSRGARDVDAPMDRMDPGRAGIRDHHARGAQDREAADDA